MSNVRGIFSASPEVAEFAGRLRQLASQLESGELEHVAVASIGRDGVARACVTYGSSSSAGLLPALDALRSTVVKDSALVDEFDSSAQGT